MPSTFRIKPTESKFYQFDFDLFLETDEEISSQVITGETGVTVGNEAISDDGRSVTCKVTAGSVVKDCTVSCKITTNTGQIEIAEMTFQVRS